MINISYQLEIYPGNKVMVPGCEPTSAISSRTLSAYLAKYGCNNAMVNVDDVLRAIPGSYVKYGSNYNRGSNLQRWLVLPPYNIKCPTDRIPDYFKILKSLANLEVPVSEEFNVCDVNGMGYCPSPDFKLADPPQPDPYKPEGTNHPAGGVLPPLPSWQGGDFQGLVE